MLSISIGTFFEFASIPIKPQTSELNRNGLVGKRWLLVYSQTVVDSLEQFIRRHMRLILHGDVIGTRRGWIYLD